MSYTPKPPPGTAEEERARADAAEDALTAAEADLRDHINRERLLRGRIEEISTSAAADGDRADRAESCNREWIAREVDLVFRAKELNARAVELDRRAMDLELLQGATESEVDAGETIPEGSEPEDLAQVLKMADQIAGDPDGLTAGDELAWAMAEAAAAGASVVIKPRAVACPNCNSCHPEGRCPRG